MQKWCKTLMHINRGLDYKMGSILGPNMLAEHSAIFFDAESIRSNNTVTFNKSMLTKWYCFISTTVKYVVVGTGGYVYEEDTSGNVTTVISETTAQETYGDISVTAGRYYWSNKPVNFFDEAAHHVIAPLSLCGNVFYTDVNRYLNISFRFFSPYTDATVEIFKDGSGINGTPVTTLTITQNVNSAYTATSNGNWFIKSSAPILFAREGNPGDRALIKPMERSRYIYIRDSQFEADALNAATELSNAYYVYDSGQLAQVEDYGDGAGGDMDTGDADHRLSDTYYIPEGITSYFIVAPNTNTVTVEYKDASNVWQTYNTHTYTGTATAPGTTSVGAQSGSGAVLAGPSNGLWRFTGDDVFYVCINDESDDEESLLGFMDGREKPYFGLMAPNIIKNIAEKDNFAVPNNVDIIDYFAGTALGTNNYFDFHETWDRIIVKHSATNSLTNNFTISTWLNFDTLSTTTPNGGFITPFSKSQQNYRFFFDIASQRIYFRLNLGSTVDLVSGANLISVNEWNHFTFIKSSTEGMKIYLNGNLEASNTQTGAVSTNTNDWSFGDWDYSGGRFFDGQMGNFALYNIALSDKQVKYVYNSLKVRYI